MTLQRAAFYPLALLFLNASLSFAQPTIKLIAGGNGLAPIGDGGPAVGAFIGQAGNITVDSAGNLYIWDATDSRVRKVNTAGIISSVTATIGQLKELQGTGGLATDSAGNLYIGDRQSYVVRRVDTSGVMTTIAGNGTAGLSGNNGNGSPATTVPICSPSGVVADRSGNVYFGSSICGTVRKVDPSGVLTTFAGSGSPSFVQTPWALAMDNSGNLYACDNGVGTRVYKVTPSGAITVIAGNGTNGFSGDGGPATSAQLFEARGIAVDASGNVYIADSGNLRVRKVDTSGTITTVAGGPNSAPNEVDGGPPTGVNVGALDVAVDSSGNLYIYGGNRVYKVSGLSGGSGGTTPPAAPAISANGVVNGASFQPGVAANSWVTIKGTNLAPQTDDWSRSIVNGALPTSLDGVFVTMGGKPAYVYFVSPGQLNVLAPDVPAGPLTVTVTTAGGTSTAITTTASTYGPAFFVWPSSQVVATRTDYSYAVKAGTFPGATTVAAKPGEVLILWATGFGPTLPATPLGVSVPASGGFSTVSAPTVTVNNIQATVYGAALAPGSAGLYQIAIQVPTTLADGDWPIQAGIGGVASPAGTILSVHQ
jgi:uncharacterized protein (TIGR03437 family)